MSESERAAIIRSRIGLHARPAAIFAEAVGESGLEVSIASDSSPDDRADASSVLSLMSLNAAHGDKVLLSAKGPDAGTVLDHLVSILEMDHDADS